MAQPTRAEFDELMTALIVLTSVFDLFFEDIAGFSYDLIEKYHDVICSEINCKHGLTKEDFIERTKLARAIGQSGGINRG